MLVFVIKEIRLKKNITLYKLSQMTGLSRTYLRNIENNCECNPTFYSLKKISHALDVPIKKLFYDTIEIKSLKEEMYRRIDEFGIDSEEVLEVSRIIDLLVNIKMDEE